MQIRRASLQRVQCPGGVRQVQYHLRRSELEECVVVWQLMHWVPNPARQQGVVKESISNEVPL